ncbi:TetR-like C-terminal domain-containing protein, partial [Virgisporangium aliadipatigenens]|uniref:TetR-like C-terminal domain-containing protein n=1 Tax=Virgisporangium aliadipatigenens TaxID=741659 RepID=UPI0019410AF7
LATLAKRLGVALPSLYKHVDGLPGVRQRIAARGAAELADVFAEAAAGRSGAAALTELARAYRDYAKRYPGRYLAAQRVADPLDAAHTADALRAVSVITAALRAYDLSGPAAIDATRAVRSALHGFVMLEAAGGFGLPQDVDRSFDQLVAALDRALKDWPH